jgi:hypothetical protein
MKTTTIGVCRWPLGAVVGPLDCGGVEDDGRGAELTAGAELPLPPPAHPAQTAAATHRMTAAVPRTPRSIADGG